MVHTNKSLLKDICKKKPRQKTNFANEGYNPTTWVQLPIGHTGDHKVSFKYENSH